MSRMEKRNEWVFDDKIRSGLMLRKSVAERHVRFFEKTA